MIQMKECNLTEPVAPDPSAGNIPPDDHFPLKAPFKKCLLGNDPHNVVSRTSL